MNIKGIIIMRKCKIYLIFYLGLVCLLLSSCFDTSEPKETVRYRLFETTNRWTFLQLDTATGRIWQIQYDVEGDNRGGVVLNSQDLSNGIQRIPGRFTLYPTQNMWNYILLDQINGSTWQIQWSQGEDKRGIIGSIFRFQ